MKIMNKTVIILQTINGKEKTRTEYTNWPDAMNDGCVMQREDKTITVAIFAKNGEFDFD